MQLHLWPRPISWVLANEVLQVASHEHMTCLAMYTHLAMFKQLHAEELVDWATSMPSNGD